MAQAVATEPETVPMFDTLYRRRLERDLEAWTADGLINERTRSRILARLPDTGLRDRFPLIVALLGAVLLAFGAITFVAANWNEISRPVRLALLLSAMWAAYGISWWLARRQHPTFADGAVMLGTAVFGANIMLIAQMYHIASDNAEVVLVWGLGGLLACALVRSRGALVLGVGLICIWSWFETFGGPQRAHWTFLLAWAPAAWLAWRDGWPPLLHVATLAAGYWATITLMTLAEIHGWPAAAAITLMVAAAFAVFALARCSAGLRRGGLLSGFESALVRYGLAAALLALFVLQTAFEFDDKSRTGWNAFLIGAAESASVWIVALAVLAGAGLAALLAAWRRGAGTLHDAAIVLVAIGAPPAIAMAAPDPLIGAWANAALYLGVCLWCMALGQRLSDNMVTNLALIAFGGELLYVYFVTFGTLIDTAVFFLIGGGILILVAAVLVRIRRRMIAAGAAGEKAA